MKRGAAGDLDERSSGQVERDLEYIRSMMEFGHNDARHVYLLVTVSLGVGALFAVQLFKYLHRLPLGGRILFLGGLVCVVLAAVQFFLYLQARHLSWRDTAACLRTADVERAQEIERQRIVWLFYTAAGTMCAGAITLLVVFAWTLLMAG